MSQSININWNIWVPCVSTLESFKNLLDIYFSRFIFEDGMTHPLEEVLPIFLNDRDIIKNWIEIIIRDSNYGYRYELLRCVGRLPYELVKDWAILLVKDVLKWPDKTMRDAAISDLEVWETPECMEILENHHDPDSFLADYVTNILRHHYCL